MALTAQESEGLHEEARKLYEAYGALKAKARADRSRVDLQRELDSVRSRYDVIVEELRQSGASPIEESVWIREFDVGHYRAHKPVREQVGLVDGHTDRVLSLLRPRVVISVVVAVFFVTTFYLVSDKTIGFFVVPSSSMEPTLVPDDKLMTLRKTDYRRGDIVVIRDPVEKGAFLVKRIVAVGNDDVYIHEGVIVVNKKRVEEPYIREPMDYEYGPKRIPEGYVFVLGDNRNYSDDGHKWNKGVAKDTIVGEVRYIYGPRNRASAVASGSKYFSSAGV
jgi:signal peptidase I